MASLLIKNANVVLRKEVLENYSVYCTDGKIQSISPEYKSSDYKADETYDAGGMYLAPGYIDMHIHGTMNKIADNGADEIRELTSILPRYGVTGFLPTLTPKHSQKEDISFMQEISGVKSKGTQILGFFLEGHFLHLTGAISHLAETQDISYVEDIKNALAPYKAVFGISPEIEKIDELIPHMISGGMPAFITHTSANAQQTKKAIKAGALHATHFYDVFPYMGDREGGVRGCGAVEAILASPQVSVDFIFDGEHVEPVALEMALTCKGEDNVSLVTDANLNAGLPPGKYKGIGGVDIEMLYEGGPARNVKLGPGETKGGLVGSGLTMEKAVKNAVSILGVSIPQAVAMASSNPAKVLNLDARKGFVKKGYDADMILLDKNLNVKMCWVGGKNVYEER
jgi:N-acetylglucosamine-6-phosphate deacetylase